MEFQKKIDGLWADAYELDRLITEHKETDTYPPSFFERTIHLLYKLKVGLRELEEYEMELTRQRMEEHKRLIESMPLDDEPLPEETLPQGGKEAKEVTEESAPTPEAEEVVRKLPEVETKAPEPVATAEKPGRSLNDMLEKKNLADFRKAFSLNDRFRFRRELFKGDEEAMNEAIDALNSLQSYDESVAYLSEALKWNLEEAPVADFLKLLEKRFS